MKKFIWGGVGLVALVLVIGAALWETSGGRLTGLLKTSGLGASIVSTNGLIIYNGENASILQGNNPCLSYGEEISPGRNGNGKAFKLNPDAWHAPGYAVNCGGQDRLNLSAYSYLEFYVKGNSQTSGTRDFNVVSYYGRSNTVNLLKYVQGGVIDDTWRLVSIPTADLKTASYNLSTVDTLYFGTDSQNRTLYVDDIVARQSKTTTDAAPAPVAATVATQTPDVLTLYNGSTAPILFNGGSPCLEYAQEGPSYGRGVRGIKLFPDPYHSPDFKVYCGGRERLDLSGYAAIEFYMMTDSFDSPDPEFNVVSYFGKSATVKIKNYIHGGVVDINWRLVSIPISALKTSTYNLNTVDNFYFGTDAKSRPLYIYNLIVTKNKTSVNTSIAPQVLAPVTPVVQPPPVVVQPPVVKPPVIPVIPVVPITPVEADTPPVVKPPVKDPVLPEPVKPVEEVVTEPLAPIIANTADILYDYDEVDRATLFGQWVYPESKDYISLNFTQKYDTNAVTNVSNYSISSTDDSNYKNARNPASVGYRWRTLYAPLRKTDLKVIHRAFLRLPAPLQNGKTYTVTARNLGIPSSTFTFTHSDENLNTNIKVNQVGYLPTSKKYGYVGQYMGTAGPMPFNIGSFEVRKASTGAVVQTGTPRERAIDTNNTGENVYELDFSSLTTPGIYYLRVPGVGISFPFRIGSDVYNEVASNAMKGAYHQRSGTALTSEFTRFTHGLAHQNDAYVMNHDPIPDWFRYRFDSQGDTSRKDSNGRRKYYPTSLSGQYISTNKGHYDAGDYGKYVVNGSLFAGNILAGFEAFPERLMKDDLQIPESGNGIPDLIDEVKWELDWLENMQDPNDGGVFCIVKPDGAVEYYENRVPDEPSPSKRLLYAKDTTCTGAYAAALAKAGQSPLIQKHYPDAAARYVKKAELAWKFLTNNPGYLGWHHYGLKDEFDSDKSMDERVWAAMELFGATGKDEYMRFVKERHRPDYVRWGWNTLFEASGQANYACAFETRAGMDASMKTKCRDAIIKAADSHVIDSNNNRAYRLSMSNSPLSYRDYTYFFPQERTIQLLIANSLKPKADYVQAALYNYDYILGANPTSYSYVTGIGSKRFREPVSTQSTYDTIKPPIPGIPIGMGNNFGYLEIYGSKLAQMFPPNNGGSPDPKVSYPLLQQIYDSFNIGVEFTVPEISENIVSATYFSTSGGTKNAPPSSINITANPASGPAPLTVKFQVNAQDPDGQVVRYHWDFDDESYSIKQNPVHIFKDPYKTYKVVLTVTDNDGAEKFKQIDIRTSPASFSYTAEEYAADTSTIALFHFNNSLADASDKYKFSTKGSAALTNTNVQWMKNPRGSSLEFNSVNDTATVEIPSARFKGGTLVAEAKIFVESYLSLNSKSSKMFTLEQGDAKGFGLYDAIYVDGTHVTSMDGYNNQKIILSKDELAKLMAAGKMKTNTWYNLKFVVSGGKLTVYANNDKIVESNIAPQFGSSDQPVRISVGGFKGFIDEIRLRSAL